MDRDDVMKRMSLIAGVLGLPAPSFEEFSKYLETSDDATAEPVGAAEDTDATEVTEIMMNRRQRRRQERELCRRERRASSRTGLLRAKK